MCLPNQFQTVCVQSHVIESIKTCTLLISEYCEYCNPLSLAYSPHLHRTRQRRHHRHPPVARPASNSSPSHTNTPIAPRYLQRITEHHTHKKTVLVHTVFWTTRDKRVCVQCARQFMSSTATPSMCNRPGELFSARTQRKACMQTYILFRWCA